MKISKDEFKDRLFDLMNESDMMPIKDLTLDDRNNIINLVLTDDTSFLIHVSEPYQKALNKEDIMKNKTFFNSVKAVLLSMAIMATSCIPMSLPVNNTVIAEAATKIKLNKTNITIKKGFMNDETYQLKVIGTNKKIIWSSSKETVATVNQKGKVTAKKFGTTIITAKIGSQKLKCKVTVTKKDINNVFWDINELTLHVGDVASNHITVMPDDVLVYYDVIWKSSNESVAYFQHGIVHAISPGIAVLSAEVGGKIGYCKVTVLSDEAGSDQSTNSIASNSGYDKLYQILYNSKSVDSNGNHYINYCFDDWTFTISYNNNKKQFEFTSIPDDHETLITIYIDRNGSQKALIDFCYFNNDASIDCHGTGYLSVSSHTETTEINFNFDAGDYHFLEAYKRIANIDVRLCLLGIQKLLQNNTNITLYDLGFLKF